MLLGKDNQAVLNGYGDFLWSAVADRFNSWLSHGDSIFSMSPVELVQNGICDPIKLFIKNEPHKTQKIVDGKLRLIASVSICDQLCTRVLCSRQNKAEIAIWESCPSKPGIGLHDDGMRAVAERAREMLKKGPIAMTDVSGWDWSVKEWELALDARIRAALAGKTSDSLFGFMLRVHAYCVAQKVFVLSNGKMYSQTKPGGQASGDYNTSSSNSRMRVVASLMARLRAGEVLAGNIDVEAMGDDSYERYFSGLKEGLEAIGHKVKLVELTNTLSGLEFCSHKWTEEGFAYPVNPDKSTFRYCSHNASSQSYPELMAQLVWFIRHLRGEEADVIREIAAARVARATNLGQESLCDDYSCTTQETSPSGSSG